MTQRPAGDVFHFEVVQTGLLAEGVNRDDVGVHEACGGAPLRLKAFHIVAVLFGTLGKQDLQGTGATQVVMVGEVHPPHRAGSEERVDVIDTKIPTDQIVEGSSGGWRDPHRQPIVARSLSCRSFAHGGIAVGRNKRGTTDSRIIHTPRSRRMNSCQRSKN